MPHLRSLLLAVVATLAAVAVGVVATRGEPPAPAPPAVAPPPVALEALETTEVAVGRGDFCPAVPPEAVEAAVGGEVADSVVYGNGRRARVVGDVRDVAHEFSCAWSAPDGTVARAWVFVPPVTTDRAEDLAQAARRDEGCASPTGAPSYGRPTVALVCEEGDSVRQSFRGLFGDAWLTCQLTVPDAVPRTELAERTSRWCAAVVQSAAVAR